MFIHTNSSPSYVSSLVTICSSLQSRQALQSSSQSDFGATWSPTKFGNHAFALPGPAERNISCRTSFANLHHYRFVKLTSRHTCSKFITTRLSSVTCSCANCFLFRCAMNDSLITILIKIIKMHVISSGVTTLIIQILNGVRKSVYFHDDVQSKF